MAPFNLSFQNCLWKVKNNPANATATNIIANQAPLLTASTPRKDGTTSG